MKTISYISYLLFWLLTFHSSYFYAQQFESLVDSVELYKNTQPDKAIEFGLEAINIGYEKDPNVELLKINTLVGQLLGEQNIDGQAIRFYNESLKLFSAIPRGDRVEQNIQFPPWVLVNIGNIYFKNNDLASAEKKYKEAKTNFLLYQNAAGKNFGLSTVYDNLALIALNRKDFDLATSYYLQSSAIRNESGKAEDILYSKIGMLALQIRQRNLVEVDKLFCEIKDFYVQVTQNDDPKASSSGYLLRNYGYGFVTYGDFLLTIGNYQKALSIFNQAVLLLRDFPVEQPSIQTFIAECYFSMGDLKKAEDIAQNTLANLPSNKFKGIQKKNLTLLEKIYYTQGNITSLLQIKDVRLDLFTSEEAFRLDKSMGELESYLLLSEKQDEIAQNRLRYIKYIYALVLVCILLMFLFFIFRLNYRLQKIKSKEALAEKRLIQMELDNKNLALINKSNFIAQHNKNLNYILSSSQKVKEDPTVLKAKIESLLTSFKVNERFEKQFEEVYPNFFKNLMHISGNLTQNDLRLCACMRLNQSTKEIAFMLGVSIRTIESQKYRLKKKLKLLKEDSLATFLHKI